MVGPLLMAAAVTVSNGGPWIADEGASFVEWRWNTPDPGSESFSAGTAGVLTPTLRDGVAIARVEGLVPGAAVPWKWHGRKGDSSGVAHALPPEGSPVSMVVFGDTRSDAVAHAEIAAQIRAAAPDLVVNTGDLVADGTDPSLWVQFFDIEGALLSSTPLFSAPGNHDERSLNNRTLMDRYFPQGPWFEVSAGVVRLIFIDSNRAFGAGSRQGAWLAERLDAGAADRAAGRLSWIAVVHHHPAFSSSGHGSDRAVQRELVPLYEAKGVDVVFNGHDHDFERLEKNGVVYYVSGGGGAPLYDFRTILPESRAHLKTHHLLKIAADRSTFSIDALDPAGTVLDRLTLRSDRSRPPPSPASGPGRAAGAALGTVIASAIAAWWWSGRALRG